MIRVDLSQAVRSLARQPGFTAVTVLTLALGMGVNTAVFSVLHSVLLAPLPYPQSERLVRLYQSQPDRLWFLPGASFLDYRENLASMEGLASIYDYSELGADLIEDGRARRVRLLPVSADYFPVLAAEPLLGRIFTHAEELPNARIAVVSEALWRSALGADPRAPGRTLALDGESWTVLGVLPKGFVDPLHGEIDIWIPDDLTVSDFNAWYNNRLTVIGRLAPGVTLEKARAEVALRSERQQELSTESNEDIGAGLLVSLHEDLTGPAKAMLLAVMGAVSLLLLITCVNVASLLLARGASREREMAVRAALGSGRARLVQLVLLESLVLSVAGAALGLAVGVSVQKSLVSLAPAAFPRQLLMGYGAPVVLFGAALAVAVGLALGAVPAWQLSRPRPGASLHKGARGSEGTGARRARRVLVVTEVALALVLLVGAGLLIRTLDALRRVPLGFEPRNVWTFQVNLPEARYGDRGSGRDDERASERTRLHEALMERLARLPGVDAAGAVSRLPLTGSYHPWGARRAGGGTRAPAQNRVVAGDYFAAMGIQLVAGRLFGPEDGPESPRSVVASRRLARILFPDRDPLGQRIDVLVGGGRDLEIIGVVEDVSHTPVGEVEPIVYHAHAQFAFNRNWALTHVVGTSVPLRGLPELARQELAGLDPALVLHQPRSMEEIVGAGRARQRFAGVVLGAFALLALLLACLGVYGVLAFSVAQRRRELGVRLALGARAAQLGRMVVWGGLTLTGAGVVLGALGALALGRLLSSLLFEVSPTDPLVFVAAPVAVIVTGLLASYLPARCATAVDPAESLREE